MDIHIHIQAPSPAVRRLAVYVGLPIAILVGSAAVARAAFDPPPSEWVAKDNVVSAKNLAQNLNDLDARVNAASPPGTIVAYGGSSDSIPEGWLLCDGRQLDGSIDVYKPLFEAIGVSFGGSKADKLFNVPDLRGRFLRGDTGGTANDPDAAGRQPSGKDGSGDAVGVGSLQADAFASHSHGLHVSDAGHQHQTINGLAAGEVLLVGGPQAFTCSDFTARGSDCGADIVGNPATGVGVANISATMDPSGGGTETRPVNISVNFLIKR